MPLKRLFALSAALLVVAGVVYFAGTRRQPRKTRVSILRIPNQSELQSAETEKFFRGACPDMVLIKDASRADYTMGANWSKNAKWGALVNRRDNTLIWFGEVSADAMETFRRTCEAIRNDASEVADFNAHEVPLPTGRYSLSSAQDRILLIDSKTGAIWKLEQVGNSEQFDRIEVEGLYGKVPF